MGVDQQKFDKQMRQVLKEKWISFDLIGNPGLVHALDQFFLVAKESCCRLTNSERYWRHVPGIRARGPVLITGARVGEFLGLQWTDDVGDELHFLNTKNGRVRGIQVTPRMPRCSCPCPGRRRSSSRTGGRADLIRTSEKSSSGL